jgi:flavoprotein
MNIAVHPRCKRCRRIMTSVAEIAPIGNDAGLLVLICAGCGTADSVFICPKQKEPSSAEGVALGSCRRNACA